MKTWKAAALAALIAAGLGAAMTPGAQAQSRAVRAQAPRAVEIFGNGSRIGVSIRDIEETDAKTAKGATAGVVVDDVSPESPAEKAGVRKGDMIVEFDGERVRSARQLTRLVTETPAGRSVQAILLRDGQRTSVAVVPREGGRFSFEDLRDLGEWGREFGYRVAPRPPAPPAVPARPAPPAPPSPWNLDELIGRSNRLGISVDALSPQLAEYFAAKQGVLVTSVTDESAAAKAGLKAGDVITSFNGSTVDEPSDVRRRVQGLDDGDEFTIDVMRDRKALTLKGKAERNERRRSSRTVL